MRTTEKQNRYSRSSVERRVLPVVFVVASLLFVLPLAFTPSTRAGSLAVPMTLSYNLVTPASGVGAPTFTYIYQGQQQSRILTTTPTNYVVDLGTLWSISSALPGSSSTAKWSTPTVAGIATNETTVFNYYKQYIVNFGCSVAQGGTGPIVVDVVRFGVPAVVSAGGPSWVDAGTSFSYPSVFESGVGDRWISTGLSGLVTAPANYTLVYDHQYYVNETFSIFGGGTFPAPVFSGTSSGKPISVTLSSQVVGQWLDAGSNYSISSTEPPPTRTERWTTGIPVSGAVDSALNLLFYYYHQYLVNLNYIVYGGGRAAPLVAVTQYGSPRNVSAGTSSWIDAGGNIVYPKVVTTVARGERWASDGMNATVSGPANFTLVYYHQYLYTGSYSVVGGGLPTSPTLQGRSLNSSVTATLTGTNESLWLDAGSAYSVTDPLGSSNSSVRWYATGASGVVSSPTYNSLVYFHQFGIRASYSVVNGTSPAAPTLVSTSFSVGSVQYLAQSPITLWVDAGAKYTVTYSLTGSSPVERWVLNGNITGRAESPLTIEAVYYHQDLVTLDFPPQSIAQAPVIRYRAFGEAVATSVPLGRSSYWADSGCQLLLNGTQAGSGSGDRWVPSPAPPSVLKSPLNLTLVYVHQFRVTASYSVSGGGSPALPTLTATSFGVPLSANLAEGGTTLWLDAGTRWNVTSVLPGQAGSERWIDSQANGGFVNSSLTIDVDYVHQYYLQVQSAGGTVSPSSGWYNAGSQLNLTAVPPQGWAFGEWKGTGLGSYSGGNSATRLILNGSVEEVPVFDAQLRISVGGWGSVTYVSASGKGVVRQGVTEGLLFPAGSNVTLVATPSSFLYAFSGWSGSHTGSDGRVALTVNSPMQIRASFALNYAALASVIVLYVIVVLLVAAFLMNRKKWSPLRLLRQARSSVSGGARK